MSKYPNVTLLIQGQLIDKTRIAFCEFIEDYKKLFGEIILSSYLEHFNDDILKFCVDHKIRVVLQTDNIYPLENKYNITYQTLSTRLGLMNVNTKYTLKHRTDERYSNLYKLVDLFLEDDEKWVSGGTFFGAKSYQKFHAADHLFIGKTEKLFKTFDITKTNLENNIYEKNAAREPAAEVTFTKNFIRVSGHEPIDANHDEMMLKYFNFINDREFYPFFIRFNSANKIFTELSQRHECFDAFNSIEDCLHSGTKMVV